MRNLDRSRIEVLKTQYPVDCAVELVHMDDSQAPPVGTRGKVLLVDDIGTIHVAWESGSTLGIVPGVDMIRRLNEEVPPLKVT